MHKINKRKLAAIFLAAIMLVSAQAAFGARDLPTALSIGTGTGRNYVADYLAERGITAEEAGLATSQPLTPAEIQAQARAAMAVGTAAGGFVPSTVQPFANSQSSIRSHAAVNSDVKGWLVIPNTNITHPITLSTADNNYYLYRDWRGNNYAGRLNWQNWNQFPDTASYLDFRTRLGNSWANSSRNINIYGHNWNNLRHPLRIGNHPGFSMFAQLKSYTDINFATSNPHIYFSTGDMEGIWRVFAVGYAHTTPMFFYNNPNPSREATETLISEWRARSHINFNVPVSADDRLLTLTTCTRVHGTTDTQRFVVVARLLRPGESENDVVTATPNTNIRHPDFTQPTRLPPAPASAGQTAPAADTGNPTPQLEGTPLNP
ncbi:MAG: class B sortase [Oscillospiraceae bacterium]|nr:class B sortase [Oscillospiraceae bacterium]